MLFLPERQAFTKTKAKIPHAHSRIGLCMERAAIRLQSMSKMHIILRGIFEGKNSGQRAKSYQIQAKIILKANLNAFGFNNANSMKIISVFASKGSPWQFFEGRNVSQCRTFFVFCEIFHGTYIQENPYLL